MSSARPPPDATQVILGSDVAPGRLAQYEIVRKVGAGAMGAVYLARDRDLDRPVAIKLLHITEANPAARELAEERFLREARSAAQLNHPNVAVVYQVGRDGGQTFIAMEWIDGGDLGRRTAAGPMPWRGATAAVRDAAAGLAAAHARGLVHRDVKPSNLMRLAQSGTVKLVDFGLARLHEVPSDLTATGSLMGTPAYLAPEVFHGQAAGPASDLYALACTYYQLLTGNTPFAGGHWLAVMNQHASVPMPDPRSIVADVPESVVRIVRRAGAKEPARRYADAGAMLADLQAVLDGRDIAQESAPDTTQTVALVAVPPARDDVRAAAPTAPPGGASAAVVRGNLPAALGPFIGREEPAARLVEMLAEKRLVTLTGPGGTGKTRLSQHVARRIGSIYPDGVWLVELSALPPGGDAALAAAAVLGVRESADRATVAAIVEHLRPRHALLVLDNCEHLLDSAAELAARVLAGCPNVQLLATSRQPLGVPEEATLPVPPMALAADGLPAHALADVESVRLFVQRARAARPEFALTAENAAAVTQICRRLDGLPLAIELAAARVKVLSVAQIAARLDDAFKLLTSTQRTLEPRQQTLRALIDWSWELLDGSERLALARASVFAGEFSIEAAETVLAGPDDGGQAFDVLETLAGLVDKSLLVAADRGSAVRYSLLQTIRHYAAARLAADDRSATLRRHANYFTAWVVTRRARFTTPEHTTAEAEIALEHEQAKAALDAACDHRWLDIALSLGVAIAQYWLQVSHLADGVARISRLLALQPPAGADTAALLRLGAALAVRAGRLDAARAWLEQALPMARSSGAVQTVGGIHNTLGNLAYSQGHFKAAEQHFTEALAVYGQTGYRDGEHVVTSNLAGMQRLQGRFDEARRHYLRALALLPASADRRRLGHLKLNLGELEALDDQPEAALPLLRESIAVFEPTGEDWGLGLAHMVLGGCALAAGDLVQARAETAVALPMLRRHGDPSSIGTALDQLARIALRERRDGEAGQLAGEALALRLEANNRVDVAGSLNTWAALIADARPDHAVRLLGCAGAVRLAEQAPLAPPLRREEQALLASLAQRLGDEAFTRASALGADEDPMALARALVA